MCEHGCFGMLRCTSTGDADANAWYGAAPRCEVSLFTFAVVIWIVAENARGLGAMHEELLAEKRAAGEAPAGPWYVMFCSGYATWFARFFDALVPLILCSPPDCGEKLRAGIAGDVLHLYNNGSAELGDAFESAFQHFESQYDGFSTGKQPDPQRRS